MASNPHRWRILAVVATAFFMTILDVSIVNVALPSIERGLHAQQNALQWIVAGYALALGLLLVPAGRFGDAHGRRPVFIVGVGLFVVASAACALAQTPFELVLTRIVQGFGGGLIAPQISGLIQSLFRGQERGKGCDERRDVEQHPWPGSVGHSPLSRSGGPLAHGRRANTGGGCTSDRWSTRC